MRAALAALLALSALATAAQAAEVPADDLVDVPAALRCAPEVHLGARPDAPCLAPRSGLLLTPRLDFDVDKARLRPSSLATLRAVATLLAAHPEATWVEIRGHSADPPRYGRRLSDDRARAVREALVAFGVAPERLTAKGFGDTQPLYPPDGPDRAKNRRVALHVFGWRGEDVPSLQRRCAEHRCARDGGCRSVHGRCVPRDDADCRASVECAAAGGCSAVDGRCVPTRDAMCRDATLCALDGRCTLSEDRCVAGADADCRASEACRADARCTAVRGACQVGSDADCARTPGCAALGDCHWGGYGCRPASHADCAASARCEAEGACTFDPGARACAAGPGWCKPSRLCVRYGQCALKGGRCVAARAADCRGAPGCAAEGRCARDRDGRCVVSRRGCRRSAACREEGRCVVDGGRCARPPER